MSTADGHTTDGQPPARFRSIAALVAIIGITGLTFGADLFVGDKEPRPEIPTTMTSVASPGDAIRVLDPSRPTVIRFWSSTCETCAEEMRDFDQVAAEVAGVRFVSAATDVETAASGKAARDLGLVVPAVADPELTLAAALSVSSVPATVVVAPDGSIVETFGRLPLATLRERVRRLVEPAAAGD